MSIEFRQVTKRYGDAKSPLVVKGIDLLVPRGTLTTILGPSGCGKTTTLRMIAGLDAPTGGQILIDGRDVTTLGPAERNVSMVFQSYALFPHMTVLGNVGYGLSVSGVSKEETQRRARESAALFEVGRDLSSSLDLSTVMDRIAGHAKDLLHAGNSAIFLPEPGSTTCRPHRSWCRWWASGSCSWVCSMGGCRCRCRVPVGTAVPCSCWWCSSCVCQGSWLIGSCRWGVSLCFSSSCEGLWRRVGGPVGLAVSEHGEQDIDSAPGEADECGVVFLALGSFPVVVGPADGIGSERGER